MRPKQSTRQRKQKPPAAGVKVLAVLGVLVACVVLAACGSSSTSSNGSAGASNQGTKQENSRLKFTACMREHGVNIPKQLRWGRARRPREHSAEHYSGCRQSLPEIRLRDARARRGR